MPVAHSVVVYRCSRLPRSRSQFRNDSKCKAALAASCGTGNRRVESARLFFFAVLALFTSLSFGRPALSADVTLAWDPNRESDLAGYCTYFRKDAPGASMARFGCVTVQELSDRNKPQFVVTGLELGPDYCFAVTAFNTGGNESNHSEQVCGKATRKDRPWLPLLLED